MKRVESGLLGVEAIATGDLAESFDAFEEHLPTADYLVGWLDAMPRGACRGRGILHAARYLEADADGRDALRLERQENPTTLLGVPKRWLWRAMRPMMNGPGVALVNTARYLAGRRHAGGAPERWTHTEYAFLLDSIPDWRLAYGGSGFIQYQPFVPAEHAREVMTRLLAMCRKADLPPYLVVLKRHRPDAFLLGHGLDGYSLAMDLRVRPAEREALWQLCHRMSDCVLEAGGRFHPAKDALLRADDVRRALGDERLDAFRALRARLDPEGVLRTDLARRWLGEA